MKKISFISTTIMLLLFVVTTHSMQRPTYPPFTVPNLPEAVAITQYVKIKQHPTPAEIAGTQEILKANSRGFVTAPVPRSIKKRSGSSYRRSLRKIKRDFPK